MSDSQNRLLVYGLLRRGMSMEKLMQGVTQFVNQRRVPGFVLYNLGRYPGAVRGEGELVAELYSVTDPAAFQTLDEAEGVFDDPPHYRRIEVELADGAAWIYEYVRSVDDCELIPSGDWSQR